jgi:hypothetical protein
LPKNRARPALIGCPYRRFSHGWGWDPCLEKDRTRRYETANGLARDIQRHLTDEPVEACPPSAWYQSRKFASRNWRVLVTVTLLAAALGVFLVVNSVMVGRERRRTAEQRDLAVGQRGIAIARTRESVERAETLERQLAINRVNRAHGEWEANSVAAAERFLDECPPALRGWEWHYVKRLCHLDLLTYRGHKGIGAWGVAFSPNGKLIASGAGGGWYRKPGQGEVAVWDAATGKEVFARRGLKAGVQCVAFSPDGGRPNSRVTSRHLARQPGPERDRSRAATR